MRTTSSAKRQVSPTVGTEVNVSGGDLAVIDLNLAAMGLT
jgi:hypothetical protein